MTAERGVIRNRDYATQIRDFSGLRFKNITPTDIDGLIEYHNKAYVVIEIKYMGSELPYGQRLALERMCDDLSNSKQTIGIVASHSSTGDIDVGNIEVIEMRYRGHWYRRTNETVRQLVEKFISWVDYVDLDK